MGKVKRLLELIDNLNEWVGRIIAPLSLVMIAVIVCEVLLRYIFNNPTIWAHETAAMLFGAYFILGGGYALRHRAHVNMDVIYDRLSLRGKGILDVVTSPLFFIFCGLLLWEGGQMFWNALQIGERTSSYWKPLTYPVKLMIPLGASLILLQGSAKLIRDLHIAITGKEGM